MEETLVTQEVSVPEAAPEVAPEVVPEVPVPTIPEPIIEIVYNYQPKDDQGRNLGAPQVFKGKNWEEISEKIAESNKNLIKLNRELNRRVRLGDFEKETLPETAVKITNENVLKARELTAEEKAQLSRDLLDPEKFDQANTKLIEAQFGAKPEDIRNRINNQERRLADIEARQEAEFFAMSNPDYYACSDNFTVITGWMVKNGLAPVRENFQTAFDTLKAQGLMLDAPVPDTPKPIQKEEVVVEAPVVPVAPVTPVAPVPTPVVPSVPVPAVAAPSGLTRELSSNVGTPIPTQTLTRRDIEKMSSEEYKRRLLTDRNFARIVDEAYAKR